LELVLGVALYNQATVDNPIQKSPIFWKSRQALTRNKSSILIIFKKGVFGQKFPRTFSENRASVYMGDEAMCLPLNRADCAQVCCAAWTGRLAGEKALGTQD
jgi:hypothetical protein